MGGPWRVGVMCVMAARVRVHDVVSPVRSSLFNSAFAKGFGRSLEPHIPASVSGKEGRDGLVVHAYLSKVGGVVAPARSAR